MSRLVARLCEMAESEILSAINAAQYVRIKAKDSHPVFKAYVVGHEGESTGKVSIEGEPFFSVAKRWLKGAIKNMHDLISGALGLKLFVGHDYGEIEDPSRQPIGEVVGNKLKEIGGKLSEIIVAYIYEPFRNLPLDVASIEADVILEPDGSEFKAEVSNISGIALGNSGTETPGFPGATLLGVLAEFAENQRSREMGGGQMTLEELKAKIKADNLKPSDLFALEDLTGDPTVKAHVDSETRTAKKGEYEHRKRTDEAFDRAREEWADEKKKLVDENKSLRSNLAQTDISEKLPDIFKKRRIEDEKEQAFIKSELEDFKPQDPDALDKELDAAIDEAVTGFQKYSKIFGDGNGKETKGGGETGEEEDPGNGGGSGGEEEDPEGIDRLIP